MEAKIICKSVRDLTDPILEQVEKTYTESFPEAERRDFALVRNLLAQEPKFFLQAILKDEQYVGFITCWKFEGYTYAEHFAIDPAARNGGIGAKVLKQFLESCGTPVVLEVEMPTDEMSRRRIGFYERLGFVLDNHYYRQPPYRSNGEWLEMKLMTYGDLNLSHTFEQIKTDIYTHVYRFKS